MPVCFFDANYDNKYTCDYEIKEGVLEVEVNYNIMDEVPVINGMRKLGTDTEFKTKDILIVDYHLKRNILAKNAWFAGTSEVWGTPDGGSVAKYRANLYFEHSDSEKLANLPQTPKAKKIKIFSKAILDWIGTPSLERKKTNSYISYKLSKEYEGDSIEINKNYVKQITVSDSWDTLRKTHEKSISINFMGYIELELTKKVDYISLPQFVNELQVFMQLYCPDRFIIEKIHVMIDEIYYVFNMPLLEIKNNGKYMERTVNEDVLPFLEKCYAQIPYRNSKIEIRNIPYIVLKTHRSLEDSFLMFYRFVECYYKKAEPKDKKKFLSFGFLNHYTIKHNLTEEQIEKYIQEIICLRNHYVHAGYYIKNESLKISFERVGRKKNPKDYTANDVDAEWIYSRTKMLYQIVVDIIFRKMLGYNNYHFTRHF